MLEIVESQQLWPIIQPIPYFEAINAQRCFLHCSRFFLIYHSLSRKSTVCTRLEMVYTLSGRFNRLTLFGKSSCHSQTLAVLTELLAPCPSCSPGTAAAI